jgi:hypothetical protein
VQKCYTARTNNQNTSTLLNLRNTFFGFLLLALISSCGDDDPFSFEDDYSLVPDPFSVENVTPDTTESGLIVYHLEEGSNELEVSIRDIVRVYYTGRKTNGDIFDSSYKNLQLDPAQFVVSNLIDGFTEGLIGMKEGEKRVLVVPPELGYAGTTNSLREDTLVFDVELETIIF